MCAPSTAENSMTITTANPAAYGRSTRPPAPPDFTDEAVKRARNRQLALLLAGGSRRGTFSGPGEGGPPAGQWKGGSGKSTLGGY